MWISSARKVGNPEVMNPANPMGFDVCRTGELKSCLVAFGMVVLCVFVMVMDLQGKD